MPLIPSEQEIEEMAKTAKWLSKVEGITIEAAVDRVSRDWETKARAEQAQYKKDRAGRSRVTIEQGKKPLTTSLGDLLKAKGK